MSAALDNYQYDEVRSLLLNTVNGYNPQHEIRDLIYTHGSKGLERVIP